MCLNPENATTPRVIRHTKVVLVYLSWPTVEFNTPSEALLTEGSKVIDAGVAGLAHRGSLTPNTEGHMRSLQHGRLLQLFSASDEGLSGDSSCRFLGSRSIALSADLRYNNPQNLVRFRLQ